jgi:L-lactate dehydrogenase (cytochrome)
MSRSLDACINVADFRRLARRRVPRPIMDFVEGGAEDELTLARNRAAFEAWALVPQVMTNVSRIDASIRILGQQITWPFLVGPTGMQGLLHADGEIGLARAAADVGALYCLSTMSTHSIEEVAVATGAPKAFQLYVFRDRGISLELLQRARDAGYVALILTVDVQVPANRERDRRNGMIIPPQFNLRGLVDFARRPVWCWNTLVRNPMRLANFGAARSDPGVSLMEFIKEQFDPSISWKDLEWVASQWNGPVAIKGVMSPADAQKAVDHGASAIIISNHGGRQLDAVAAPMDVLPSMVDRIRGRAELILDGGVRRGTDVLKAIALGAQACMSGRVGLYGLGAAGVRGASLVLRTLRNEFDRDLAMAGVTSVAELGRNHVMPLTPQRYQEQSRT